MRKKEAAAVSQFENSEKETMSSRHAKTEGDYTRDMHGKSNVK
jgi:hypothetical protein